MEGRALFPAPRRHRHLPSGDGAVGRRLPRDTAERRGGSHERGGTETARGQQDRRAQGANGALASRLPHELRGKAPEGATGANDESGRRHGQAEEADGRVQGHAADTQPARQEARQQHLHITNKGTGDLPTGGRHYEKGWIPKRGIQPFSLLVFANIRKLCFDSPMCYILFSKKSELSLNNLR